MVTEPLQCGNPLVEQSLPTARQPFPIARRRCAAIRQRVEGISYLVERQAKALCSSDHGHSAQLGATKAPLVAESAFRLNQALLLVEAKSRRGNAGTLRGFPNRQQIGRFHSLDITT